MNRLIAVVISTLAAVGFGFIVVMFLDRVLPREKSLILLILLGGAISAACCGVVLLRIAGNDDRSERKP